MFRKNMLISNWNTDDSTAARAQGWDVYEVVDNGHYYLEIQRDDASNIFLTDTAARDFVKALATKQKTLHHRAYMAMFLSKTQRRSA
ncbi:MAG: hypothetical protein H7327_04760 [Herminiimonas sp.]|nr:hypothetical protein [Herminiimonas sp.]